MTQKIALALGAGGARGLAHVHALKAFDDLGVKPSIISGSSIGGLIGAMYCAGMTGKEIEKYMRDCFDDRIRLIGMALKVRPTSLTSFLADGGLRFGELNLEQILAVFLPPQVPANFEELDVPLKVTATDYDAATNVVFSSGALQPALAASAAMPAVFLPVNIGDAFYIDGNATNPCPLDLVQDGSDHVIAIDVSGGPTRPLDDRPGKFDAMYASSQIMQQTIVKLQSTQFPKTVVLRPAVDEFRSLDFLKAAEILECSSQLQSDTARALERCLEGSCDS